MDVWPPSRSRRATASSRAPGATASPRIRGIPFARRRWARCASARRSAPSVGRRSRRDAYGAASLPGHRPLAPILGMVAPRAERGLPDAERLDAGGWRRPAAAGHGVDPRRRMGDRLGIRDRPTTARARPARRRRRSSRSTTGSGPFGFLRGRELGARARQHRQRGDAGPARRARAGCATRSRRSAATRTTSRCSASRRVGEHRLPARDARRARPLPQGDAAERLAQPHAAARGGDRSTRMLLEELGIAPSRPARSATCPPSDWSRRRTPSRGRSVDPAVLARSSTATLIPAQPFAAIAAGAAAACR